VAHEANRPRDAEPIGPEDTSGVDYRAHPERYRVGLGEQGVFEVEPYKGELLPLWRFRTPAIARESARSIFERFETYRAQGDFVGMDMARKFLQMGYTRSRRYANHQGGRKYHPTTGEPLELPGDPTKAESASIFGEYWFRARTDPEYLRLKAIHRGRPEGLSLGDGDQS